MKRKTIVAAVVCISAVFINIYFYKNVHDVLNKNFYGLNTLKM